MSNKEWLILTAIIAIGITIVIATMAKAINKNITSTYITSNCIKTNYVVMDTKSPYSSVYDCKGINLK